MRTTRIFRGTEREAIIHECENGSILEVPVSCNENSTIIPKDEIPAFYRKALEGASK